MNELIRLWRRRQWFAIALWLAAWANASGVAKEPRGGHPLANRSGSLEALLDQEDWPVDYVPSPVEPSTSGEQSDSIDSVTPPRPVMIPAQPAAVPRNGLGNAQPAVQLQLLIDRRNTLVDDRGMSFIEVIKRWNVESENLQQRLGAQQVAAAAVHQAAQAVTQSLAMGEAGQGLQAAARDRLAAAQRNLALVDQERVRQTAILQPLDNDVRQRLPGWFQIYADMRRFFSHDRRDAGRPAVLRVMEVACQRRADFYEGHVLAAIANIFEGDSEKARHHLASAHDGFAKCRLFETWLANDYCCAQLLVGRPDEVANWVKWVGTLDAKRKTTMRCWISANYFATTAKWNDANASFSKAAAKEALFGKKPKSVPEPLVGDMALFLLTAGNEKVRNTDKARQLLDLVPADSSAWQVSRARAALCAEEGAWDEASRHCAECLQRCPPTIEDSVVSQGAAYRSQRSWAQGKADAAAPN